MLALLAHAEDALLRILRRIAVPLLRVSLGAVFLWFGALKVLGATPVTDLVAGTLPWADPGWLIPFLGVVELVIGSGLIAGRTLRFVLLLLSLQLSARSSSSWCNQMWPSPTATRCC